MITFIVVCRESGVYELATRTTFASREAAQEYANGIAPGRVALVVKGHFDELRFFEARGGWDNR